MAIVLNRMCVDVTLVMSERIVAFSVNATDMPTAKDPINSIHVWNVTIIQSVHNANSVSRFMLAIHEIMVNVLRASITVTDTPTFVLNERPITAFVA